VSYFFLGRRRIEIKAAVKKGEKLLICTDRRVRNSIKGVNREVSCTTKYFDEQKAVDEEREQDGRKCRCEYHHEARVKNQVAYLLLDCSMHDNIE
jgi:hypothetical protein